MLQMFAHSTLASQQIHREAGTPQCCGNGQRIYRRQVGHRLREGSSTLQRACDAVTLIARHWTAGALILYGCMQMHLIDEGPDDPAVAAARGARTTITMKARLTYGGDEVDGVKYRRVTKINQYRIEPEVRAWVRKMQSIVST